MDSPTGRHSASLNQTEGRDIQMSGSLEESALHAIAIAPTNATSSSAPRVAVDVVKSAFWLAFAHARLRTAEGKRLTCVAHIRTHYNRPPCGAWTAQLGPKASNEAEYRNAAACSGAGRAGKQEPKNSRRVSD
jgi:hypothetical protein